MKPAAVLNEKDKSTKPATTNVAHPQSPSEVTKSSITTTDNNHLNSIDDRPTFRFPIQKLQICRNISRTVKESEFRDVKYLCSGSNAYIYTALQNEETIVVKMLKNKLSNIKVAELEMDIETQLLAAIDHPNIIAIKGAGVVPRKFVVVEHLPTGTLANVLDNPSILFKDTHIVNSRIPIRGAILIARELISALKYLHDDLSPIATVIHRDLKPQNIGFTADNHLKLLDFGLATCVKKSSSSSESYKLTGYTGTRAYMAPEVALRLQYNEKVDIYSFGILFWQIITGEVPFYNMSKDEHMKKVVLGGLRPPLVNIGDSLSGTWHIPEALAEILRQCWHPEPSNRPTSVAVLATLDALLRPPTGSAHGDRANSGGARFISISKILPGILSGKTFHPKSKIFNNSRSVSVAPCPTDGEVTDSNAQSPDGLHHPHRKSSLTFDLPKKPAQPLQRQPLQQPAGRYTKGKSSSDVRLYQMR